MTEFSEVLRQGAAHAWFYIPSAMVLGALHGLEPGHSKTMMAAFIIAVRGTVAQAALLGLSAAFSHSLVIWLLAAVALRFGSQWNAETTEPYFQLASGLMILALALWMFWRIRRDARGAHDHGHDHHHHHGEEAVVIAMGGGAQASLSIFEDGVPPVFRLQFEARGRAFLPGAAGVGIQTVRPDGSRQRFEFVEKDGLLESIAPVPEPHEFGLTLSVAHGDHAHEYEARFEEQSHGHGEEAGFQDAHEAAHARDIQKRFANRQVTTGQIVLFGLTGGLLPCPAAFTVLIVCLQLKEFTLGFALVAAFSVGLALTMVSVGTVAAWSVNHAQKKFSGFGEWMRRAPYFSCALLSALGCYMAWQGWRGIALLH